MPYFESKTEKYIDISEDDIDYKEVVQMLKNLEEDKACGPDMIHARVLKYCAIQIAVPVTIIYKKSIESGVLPKQWLSANVSPLYKKKGDKLIASNFRPVSLTCILCKQIESLVRRRLEKHLYSENLINEKQHGFVRSKSCTTNLLEKLDFISRALSNGNSVDVIYLDFAKAFDTVPHKRLMIKLEAYGITGKLLKWIKAFLSGRRQRVKLDDIFSQWKWVLSGVPQGSVLGPLLFIIYINDLPEHMKSLVKLYADDTKILSVVNCEEDAKIEQEVLEASFYLEFL